MQAPGLKTVPRSRKAVPGAVLALCLMAPLAAPLAEEAPAPESNDPVATGSGPLVTTITAEALVVEQTSAGVTLKHWAPAEELNVGDQVYYTIRVRNPGKEPVNGVTVTKRLPFGVRYIRGSAVGPACEVQFSADGGTTFSASPVVGATADGKPGRRAQASDYTHVRWVLSRPLAPGATALLRFRATFS